MRVFLFPFFSDTMISIMAIHLSSSVSELPGIGAGALKDLKNLGISTVFDLLFAVPFRYDDFSDIKTIRQIRSGEPVTVVGTIKTISARPSKNRRIKLVEAVLEDDTGELPIVWFNQEYLAKTLSPGSRLSLAGVVDHRFKRAMVNPVHEPEGRRILTGRIVPVYRLSGSLKMHRIRGAVRAALACAHELIEWLPQQILEAEGLMSLQQAVIAIHFPETKQQLENAVARLKFNELFLHQLMFAQVRSERQTKDAHAIPIATSEIKRFVDTLPFSLTQAQRRAAWEILQDMEKPNPMNRLLQGDVGSGKTVVAALAAKSVLMQGKTVVYLAPTELLCVQQHAVFCKWFAHDPIALFTRSHKRVQKEDVKKEELTKRICDGEIRCVIGTHALLEDTLSLVDVALVVIDEQHRFGVAQRRRLLEKSARMAPHLLSMTATPIPRSLALTIFGDLDISTIDHLPKGRQPVATAVVPQEHQKGMWEHVRQEVKRGGQVFIVCPVIDPTDAFGAKSVRETYTLLSKGALKGESIGVLHGRLKVDERQTVMEDFGAGRIAVLISTTVVEVGVDMPNATVMVVMAAERFGLAQLHQLRGRVGRSDKVSFCYLLPEQASQAAIERLRLLETCHNGLELAQKDLSIRGAGNVFGTAQSGFSDFKLATEADMDLMSKARDVAVRILREDHDLANYPHLRERVHASFDAVHLE